MPTKQTSPPPLPPPPAPPPPVVVPSNAITVTVSGTATGASAASTLGVSVHGRNSTNNSLRYYQRLGASAARLFPASRLPWANVTGTSYGLSLSGVAVGTQDQWLAAVAELRTPEGHDPANTAWAQPIQWADYANNLLNRYQDPTISFTADIQVLASLGMEPELILPGLCSSLSFIPNFASEDISTPQYWLERWELYRIIYVIGYLASINGVKGIEIHNEPDAAVLSARCGMNVNDWFDYLTISSAAVRAAYADQGMTVSLKAGPFAQNGYSAGSLAVMTGQSAYLQFPTVLPDGTRNAQPGPLLFDVFAYNMYGVTAQRVQQLAANIAAGLLRDTGVAVPLAVGEYAPQTAKNFDALLGDDTADLPRWASRWGAETAALLQQVSAAYAFRFATISDTANTNSRIKKNALHWADLDAPYMVGDTALSGESVRLMATRARGRPIMGVTSTLADPAYTLLAVDDGAQFRLFSIMDNPKPVPLLLDLTAWDIAPGSAVLAEEISAARYAEVGQVNATGPSMYAYAQPGWSMVMFSVIKGPAPVATAALPAAQDTSLYAGDFQVASNHGPQGLLSVQTAADGTNDMTSVALLRFNLGDINPASVLSAVLTLYAFDVGAGTNIFTVLGINGWSSDWIANDVSWSTMPNLSPLPNGQTITTIGDNFVNWPGTAPQPQVAGHLTATPSDVINVTPRRVDVTDFITSPDTGGAARTLMIFRPMRHPAYGDVPADDLTSSYAKFYSAEAPTTELAPVLTIQYR
jgi:hypothetical protein